MKAYPGQSGTGLVLYDAWAVPGVITDMCCLLKFADSSSTIRHQCKNERDLDSQKVSFLTPKKETLYTAL